MVTVTLIALSAALVALVAVLLVFLHGRRLADGNEDRVSAALEQMGRRLDALADDLTGTLARVQSDSTRSRALAELGAALEPEEIVARVADAAAALRGVVAVVVRVEAPEGGRPLVAARGVPLDEAGGHLVSGPPDGATARAVGVSFVYGSGMEPAGALRSGLAAPLRRDGETVGFVAVYGRDPHDAVDEAAVAALEGLAAAAATALENARRYGEALRRAESDALTGLGNRRAFLDLLAREVGRAHRQEQRLSLLVLDLDSFAAVNERVGQLAGDTVLRDVAERLRDCLRGSDLACRIGGDEFAVVLPASGRIDAEAMFARLQATLLRTPPALADGITVSGGIAELAATDDALALFERGVEALAQAKAAGRGTAA